MSSRQVGGGKPSRGGPVDSLPKGKSISETSGHGIEQLSHDFKAINLGSAWDNRWEDANKSKNKAGSSSSAAKQWVPQNSNSIAWSHPDVVQKLGMRNSSGTGRGDGSTWPTLPTDLTGKANATTSEADDDADDYYDSDADYEFDDVLSDEFDSDSSNKSHETRKKNRWLKELFECIDGLTVEQINDTERQWHCPACKDGPGAIDWFRGLLPLITHAKTKGGTRMKLHRELAQLLEEELERRGASAVPAGEMFGKWERLIEKTEKEIVWPPIVVIMNTRHEKDDNDKWIGIGNQELLDYFSSYAAVKARSSFGPQGHRGMSVLIFEASAVGYFEAERLIKHFEDSGKDRESWERRRVPFIPGQFYGYMAEKRDLDYFNQHSQGKSKLKFEVKSYQEMVVKQLKQMSEDNQQLIWFKNKVAREQRHSKALEESYGLVSEKLRKMQEENRVVRLRTKMYHDENKEEMDNQEQFFKDQIQSIYDARNAKEDDFEKMQQEQREKITQSIASPPSTEDPRVRAERILKSIKLQDKEMEEFVAQREKLIKSHEERMLDLKRRHLEEKSAMKRRHWEEEVAIENEFDAEQSKLMNKYAPTEIRAG